MIKNILKLVFKFLLLNFINDYFGFSLNDLKIILLVDLLNEIISDVISKKIIFFKSKIKQLIADYIIKSATKNCSYCYC